MTCISVCMGEGKGREVEEKWSWSDDEGRSIWEWSGIKKQAKDNIFFFSPR